MVKSAQLGTANTVSFWGNQQKKLGKGKRVSKDMDVDVAIIGGGFTGLSTAREILKDEPTMKVAVLEAHQVGYGASGRNGGFNMTLFGLEPDITMLRWGKERSIDAQDYMVRAVNNVRDLVREYKIKSDYEHTGMVRVAYSDPQLKRLEHSLEMFEKLGTRTDYVFQDKSEIQASIHSPQYKAGVFEANSGILNPYKHVRELKRIAEQYGAAVYENTPVLNIERSAGKITLHTPEGNVTCNKLVIAVNAWSGKIVGLPRIRNRQTPIWTSQVVTEPLSAQQWKDIGWDE
ncbi:MAG: FAD-dependent oxidoreductase, partial [Rhizobiaceae bacterium]